MKGQIDALDGWVSGKPASLDRNRKCIDIKPMPILGHITSNHGPDQRGAIQIRSFAGQNELPIA